MPPPLPRRSVWTYRFAHFILTYQPSPKGLLVTWRFVHFEDCSAFTRVAACTLALSPIRDTLIEGFRLRAFYLGAFSSYKICGYRD